MHSTLTYSKRFHLQHFRVWNNKNHSHFCVVYNFSLSTAVVAAKPTPGHFTSHEYNTNELSGMDEFPSQPVSQHLPKTQRTTDRMTTTMASNLVKKINHLIISKNQKIPAFVKWVVTLSSTISSNIKQLTLFYWIIFFFSSKKKRRHHHPHCIRQRDTRIEREELSPFV